MTAAQRDLFAEPSAPGPQWKTLYRRRRKDGSELAIVAGPVVLVTSRGKSAAIEREEIPHVLAALSAAIEAT
jgi:hypothetical protein